MAHVNDQGQDVGKPYRERRIIPHKQKTPNRQAKIEFSHSEELCKALLTPLHRVSRVQNGVFISPAYLADLRVSGVVPPYTPWHRLQHWWQRNDSAARAVKKQFGPKRGRHPDHVTQDDNIPRDTDRATFNSITKGPSAAYLAYRLNDLEYLQRQGRLGMDPWDFLRWRIGECLYKKKADKANPEVAPPCHYDGKKCACARPDPARNIDPNAMDIDSGPSLDDDGYMPSNAESSRTTTIKKVIRIIACPRHRDSDELVRYASLLAGHLRKHKGSSGRKREAEEELGGRRKKRRQS